MIKSANLKQKDLSYILNKKFLGKKYKNVF